ncbi:hypothetical protein OUZ56_031402 [Daphnia magna]|uniref:Uncharacterized protein n=1 Tax=Daphnia magna TaxID=35525 RepID=A0ABQ9ZUH6_9CRUS|nr:hypothetical protein OUZ56_031402 [Daphnia magna]
MCGRLCYNIEGLEPVSIIRGAPILKKPLTPQRPQVHLLPPPGSKSMIAWILEKTMLVTRCRQRDTKLFNSLHQTC